jgi:hypothetical protein
MAFGLAPGKLGFKIGEVLVGLQSGTEDVPETISSTQNKLHTLGYMWNPDTLAYEVPVQGLTDTELRAADVGVSLTGQTLGTGDLTEDAWGVQKVSLPYSLFHGLFTFDIPDKMWFIYEDATAAPAWPVQVYTSTNIVSTNGAAVLTTSAGKTNLVLESRLCPPYQPNRGVLFSTAVWCPLKTTVGGNREWGVQTSDAGVFFRLKADGLLYAVLRSLTAETKEEGITTTGVAGFDVEKGNIYDIQYQWRGVGNYKFFINNVLVHTFSNLGTLTALSMSNPSLPMVFKASTTSDHVAMHIGCADLSSENGREPQEEAQAAYSQAVATNGADKPVLVIFNPLTINGKVNTPTLHIHSISLRNTKKCIFKLWKTRNPADITGETLVAGYGGKHTYVQSDSTDMNAGAVRATAVTVANLEFLDVFPVEVSVPYDHTFHNSYLALNIVRGDYIVVTNDSNNGVSECVIRWGEEI